LFDSDKFFNLKAPLLELLLKRDDLNMDEIKIWESLLKWYFSQQNMKNDPTKWNKDDITKIERVLYRFIPLIRFYDIEPTDFFYKVYCYKDILPPDKDVICNYLSGVIRLQPLRHYIRHFCRNYGKGSKYGKGSNLR